MKLLENTARWRKTRRGLVTNLFGKMKVRKDVSFDLEYLHQFAKCKKFERLFLEWVKSNYNKQYKPTIDRINYKKGYEKQNIQWLTWAENRYKQRMEVKPIRAREVGQFLGNTLVAKFKSVTDVVRKTGIAQGNISSCLSGKRKTASGYSWKYIDEGNRSHSIKEVYLICPICNHRFIPQSKITKFCSRKCGAKNNKTASKNSRNIYEHPELLTPAPQEGGGE